MFTVLPDGGVREDASRVRGWACRICDRMLSTTGAFEIRQGLIVATCREPFRNGDRLTDHWLADPIAEAVGGNRRAFMLQMKLK